MYKAAVVDANLIDRNRTCCLIDQYCAEHPIHVAVECFSSGADFLSAYAQQPFQLAFLEINLPDKNGMDVAREIRRMGESCQIVFVSASAEYAVESYRVRAHDYLLKPYTEDTFRSVMTLCDISLRRLNPCIEVKEGRLLRCISLENIRFTDYCNHYIQIHTIDGIVKTYMPFAAFAQLLEPFPRFLCCYRNVMVNMDWIERVDEQDFLLRSGGRAPIARSMRHECLQRYADYCFRGYRRP